MKLNPYVIEVLMERRPTVAGLDWPSLIQKWPFILCHNYNVILDAFDIFDVRAKIVSNSFLF